MTMLYIGIKHDDIISYLNSYNLLRTWMQK